LPYFVDVRAPLGCGAAGRISAGGGSFWDWLGFGSGCVVLPSGSLIGSSKGRPQPLVIGVAISHRQQRRLVSIEVRLDLGAALTAGGADEARLDVRDPPAKRPLPVDLARALGQTER